MCSPALPLRRTLAALVCIALLGIASARDADPPSIAVAPDLLDLQTELAQLKAQAEREPGHEQPHPSLKIAYLLLAGFAKEGTIAQGLPASELRTFGLEKRGGTEGTLYVVSPNARVALIDRWIQDKSGSYVRKSATLYVLQGNQWKSSGSGTAIGETRPP